MKNNFKILAIAFFALALALHSSAQQIIRCYTTEADTQLKGKYPRLENQEQFEAWLAPKVRMYKESGQGRSVVSIPIIFHIIHDGEALGNGDNINAVYLNAQIAQLNNDFRKMPGTSGYNGNPVGADTEIEFCPAVVDPIGNILPEPGINRIDRNAVGWSAPPYGYCCGANCFDNSYIQNVIKPQSQWNPDHYLNVWVMPLNCGTLGYAQLPVSSGLGGLGTGSGVSTTDGVVVRTNSIGSTVTPNPFGTVYNMGRTATHEIGHFLGLRHIWGDGGCLLDDYCADTPKSDAANYGCPTGHISCESIDMIENYMDYSSDYCMNIFTADQKARMQAVLTNSPRRASLINSSACTPGSSNNCITTITQFPYSESFENSFGNWVQVGEDDFDWTRRSGSTPSGNTGPSAASEGNFYVYVESSSPNYSNKTTILKSPCFDLSNANSAVFTFKFHMYGASTMGNLEFQIRTIGGAWASLWSKSGNQGNNWHDAAVNLGAYSGNIIELRFVGKTGTTWQGDMAIDDLIVSTGNNNGEISNNCSSTVINFPYTESFENDFGEWIQDSGDDFDWKRLSSGTPSSNTGPSGASDGRYYAYVESSSPNYSNKTAILNSPCFDLSGGSGSLSFQYHMYGSSKMGSLALQLKTNEKAWTTIWSKSGNQGNSWQSATVDLNVYSGEWIALRFVGTTGTTWQGDMAIDDLRLLTESDGACTNIALTIELDNYPSETSWDIADAAGNVLASGGTYGAQGASGIVSESICLPDACYTFTIYDSFGDGICCSYGYGSYSLTDSGGNILASGGAFNASEATYFCLSGGAKWEDADFSKRVLAPDQLHCYPNPARSVLKVEYISNSNTSVDLKIFDFFGKKAYTSEWFVKAGFNKKDIDISKLANGAYVISIIEGEKLMSKRILVGE